MSESKKKVVRSAIITMRFEPKNKYLADIAARRSGTSLNRFVELQVEKGIKLSDGEYRDAALWDEDAIRRFELLATAQPDLLSFEEKVIWKIICADRSLSTKAGKLHSAEIAKQWNELTAKGDAAKAEMMADFLSQFKVRRNT